MPRPAPDGTFYLCEAPLLDADSSPAAPAPPPPPDPQVVAREAVARLQVPAGPVRVGPDPSVNEWNMVAVGYPIWLWTDDPSEHRVVESAQGITIILVARRVATRFAMGDGTTVTCRAMHPWRATVTPGVPSPSCGHRYREKPARGTTYSVSVTSQWQVSWEALGQSGTIPVSRTSPARPLEVGELVSLIRRPGG